jgi:hypothetical protein
MTVIIYWNFWTHKLEYIILMYLLRKYNSFNKSFHKYENYNIHNQRSCYQEDQTNVVFVDHNKQMLKIYPPNQCCNYVKNVIHFCDRAKQYT